MWLLTIDDDQGATTYHRLARERYAIGRAPDRDVVLAQLDVSRRHARLERGGDRWLVVDEGSDNGTFVNGRRVEAPTPLGPDDVVQIGAYRLSLSEGEHTNVPTPVPLYVPPARLRVLAGPSAGVEYVFARDEVVTLGFSDDCSIRLVHPEIIGVNAILQPLPDGRYEVVDASGRGIFVNGRRVARQVLEGGDAISLAGVALLRYLEPSQASDPRIDAARGPLPLGPADEADGSPRADEGTAPGAGLLGARVEAVGPVPVPTAGPEPASFRAARDERARLGAAQAPEGRRAGAGRRRGAPGDAGEEASPAWWPLADGDPAAAPPADGRARPAPQGSLVGVSPALAVASPQRERLRAAGFALLSLALGAACAAVLVGRAGGPALPGAAGRAAAAVTQAVRGGAPSADAALGAAPGVASPGAGAAWRASATPGQTPDAAGASAEARGPAGPRPEAAVVSAEARGGPGAGARPEAVAGPGPGARRGETVAASPGAKGARGSQGVAGRGPIAPAAPAATVAPVMVTRKHHRCWKEEGGPCGE
jgi:pSer/pThr/pTyr-binding forkhead associated (FHA) protein